MYIPDGVSTVRILNTSSTGLISFRIEHTARTWGADMEALLTNHIRNLLKPVANWKKLLWKNSGWISLFFGATFLLTALVGCYLTAQRFAANQISLVSQAINSTNASSVEGITARVEALSRLVASGVWEQFTIAMIVFLTGSAILAVVFGVLIEATLTRVEPSFILFTKEAQKDKAAFLERQRHSWYKFVLTIAIDILVSVASNYIFAKLFG